MQVTLARSYRCTYDPRDGYGQTIQTEDGALPSIQLKAADAVDARRKAEGVTGCVVTDVERLDEVAA
ncbi:hypothetical protein [Malikia sp.]|uniref:hypothetical protein n=1 Tax=Malikia sp. TaxID=2070706 RepID=UPI0026104514|nr:hypothetical protein [Malikia sp.]MDD2728304.1 hypothetical protein [Malikia sp.]